jgi:hypothetical protein
MRLTVSILAGAVAFAIAGTAGAQDKQKKEDKTRRSIQMSPGRSCTIDGDKVECSTFQARLDSTLAKRAALGVQVSSTGSLRDTLGVFIARVTPKGPAETAGIFEGERIVSINGVDLRLNSADAGDSYASGLASRRLTRELQKVTPGSRVNLRVWSGGRTRDVQVTAGRASELRETGAFGLLEGFPRTFTFDRMPMGNMRLRNIPRVRTWTGPDLKNLREFRFEDMPRFELRKFPDVEFYDDDDDDAKILLDKKAKDKQVKL